MTAFRDIIKTMKQGKDIHIFDYAFALRMTLFWVFLASFCFLLALSGFFHAWIVASFSLSALAFGIYITFKQKWLRGVTWEFWSITFFSIIVAAAIVWPTVPTIFSGRDQGSISQAAISLAQNHSLRASSEAGMTFFEIYGPGKALNFPGFFYDGSGNLISQFPLGYISWLAAWFSLFGITGLVLANGVLVALTLFCGYFFARNLLSPKWSYVFLALLATSFPFFWFSRFTLSENLALPLIFASLCGLLPLLRTPSKAALTVFLTSLLFLPFVRIEGFLLLFTGAVIILFSPTARSFISANLKNRIIYPLLGFLIVFVINIFQDYAFYHEIGKVIFSSLHDVLLPTAIDSTQSSLSHLANVISIWHIYGIIGFIIVGMVCVAYLFTEGHFFRLIPFFFTFPIFYYFVDSNISSDHPWMLRRFAFAALPISIFYTSLLISRIYERKCVSKYAKTAFVCISILLFSILFYYNLRAVFPLATYAENSKLLEQTGVLSSNFSNNDLVLIDRLASGDAWSMISGPMHSIFGKNTAYFFNINDLEKIDRAHFNNIYLIVPNESLQTYETLLSQDILKETSNYSLLIDKLETQDIDSAKNVRFPKMEQKEINGKIFIYEKS